VLRRRRRGRAQRVHGSIRVGNARRGSLFARRRAGGIHLRASVQQAPRPGCGCRRRVGRHVVSGGRVVLPLHAGAWRRRLRRRLRRSACPALLGLRSGSRAAAAPRR
jgi:hypothetical protein